MSFKDYPRQVDEWTGQFKPQYWIPEHIMLRLQEEVGELAREVNHRWGPKKKKSTEELKELEDEIADIFFTLMCLANSQGINLDEAFDRMMKEKHYGRDANRYEKNE